MRAAGRDGLIDGLRGIAILGVFLIHSGGFGLRDWGFLGNSFVDHAKYGVQIFFVASAYSLCLSLRSTTGEQSHIWENYAIRRIFRIIPLYFLMLTITILLADHPLGGAGPNSSGTDLASIVAHYTFANIILPQYANNTMSVEWTIAVEVGFYLVFPFLYIAAHRYKGVFIAISIASIALYTMRDRISLAIGGDFYTLRGITLLWNFHVFLIGMWVFLLRDEPGWKRVPANLWTIAAVALFSYSLVMGDEYRSGPLSVTLAAAALIMAGRHSVSGYLIDSPFLRFIGKISYSIYLTHFMVLRGAWYLRDLLGGPTLFWQFFALVLAIGLACLTYKLVEEPARNVGRSLANRVSIPA